MISENEPRFDVNAQATPETLFEYVYNLTLLACKDGPGWENLRVELLKYGNAVLYSSKNTEHYTLMEQGQRLWDFYCGYMACHRNWSQEIEEVIDTLDEEDRQEKMDLLRSDNEINS